MKEMKEIKEMKEMKVLSPTAILGYGFPEESFERGLEKEPDIIAVDGGSTDPGPYYLGAGKSFTDKEAVKRDLRLMIKAGQKLKIPVIVGTSGGSGADAHLKWAKSIVEEIAEEENLNIKVASISAEFSREEVLNKFEADEISPLPPVEDLAREDLESTTRIVGQMGVEPIIAALDKDVDVILAGRAYDPVSFAAPAIKKGFPAGLALHMGKILECASIAANPGSGSDCMLGTLRDDHFILEPMNKERKCTVTSVAAHTLYEKSNPYKLHGPGGVIDLTESDFEQIDERRVKVSGSKFKVDDVYTIKLEGAKKIGYRTISIAGTRDPIMIEKMDNVIDTVKGMVKDNFSDLAEEDYNLLFRIYGKDGVMGDLEPVEESQSHELGIVIEVVAKTQELANTICSFARSSMLHYGYPGRVATAGNLAFPYSPSDFTGGEVYEFSLHHIIEVDDPCAYFPVEVEVMG